MSEAVSIKDKVSVSSLRTPADHYKKVKSLLDARWEHEREWKLNLAFYKGKQYAFFPKRSTNLVSLPTEPAELPRYRVRLISNQIMPGVRSLVAKMTKTKPVMHAVPSKAVESAVRGAKIAERALEHWWRELDLTGKRNEAWTWAQLGGQGWWLIGYDFDAGKTITYTLDPNGQPILQDKAEELFVEYLQQQGIEPVQATVSLGEVKVTVMSPHDVILDPAPSDYTQCQYAYCVFRLTPDEVFSRWGKWVEPDTVASDLDSISDNDSIAKDLVTVYIGYFRKSKALPKGRYVVFTRGSEAFLYDGEWPYPFSELPLVKFPGIQVPGCVYDRAVTSDARPLQLEFNRSISQIVEYKNLNIAPQFTAPAGSMMRNRMTGEPGAIWYYNVTSVGGGAKPEPVQLGALPPYIFENLSFTINRIREIYQMTDVSQGQLPPNLEAGVAIDLLQEVAIDQLEPQIQQGEVALARAGTMLVELAQEYYDEPRLAKIFGPGRNYITEFSKTELKDIDIYIEAGSGIPRTRAGRMMRIQGMIDSQLIRPDQAWKYYDMADMKSIAAKFTLDEEKAFRENDSLLRGIPLNPLAMQNAIRAINAGINPHTQQPIQSEEEAQAILMDAALEPGPADNHGIEMDVHAAIIKGEEFASFPIEIQQAFFAHYEKHMQILMAQNQETTPPRVTYQIKGTAGPTASAALLSKAGVQVTPEQMTEVPLETWVTDSVDKPDVDEAANDPMSQLDFMLLSEKLREQAAKADLMTKRANEDKEESFLYD